MSHSQPERPEQCPTCHSNVRCCLNPWHDALPAAVVEGLKILASAPNLADTMIQFSNAVADRDEILQKYIKAMNAIYNSGETGRQLVLKHFGTVHDRAQPDEEKE